MDAKPASEFKHTTLTEYPDRIVGVTILDEEPGFVGIYERDAQGGLFPARTVNRKPKKHLERVIASWMAHEGENIDLSSK